MKPWVTFAGCVLVIVVLYWAQAVLVPIALAVLLTFVLTPAVGWLERWLGRVPSVLAAATLVFIVLVASTLTETRTFLGGLVEIPRVPLPASSVHAA